MGISFVYGNNSWKCHDGTMTGTLWKRYNRWTNKQMLRSVLRATWSQLKRVHTMFWLVNLYLTIAFSLEWKLRPTKWLMKQFYGQVQAKGMWRHILEGHSAVWNQKIHHVALVYYMSNVYMSKYDVYCQIHSQEWGRWNVNCIISIRFVNPDVYHMVVKII